MAEGVSVAGRMEGVFAGMLRGLSGRLHSGIPESHWLGGTEPQNSSKPSAADIGAAARACPERTP